MDGVLRCVRTIFECFSRLMLAWLTRGPRSPRKSALARRQSAFSFEERWKNPQRARSPSLRFASLVVLVAVNLCASGSVLALVSITSPEDGTTFTNPTSINLEGVAIPSNIFLSVTRVELYDGDSLLVNVPGDHVFSYTWTNPSLGAHTLTAKAYYSNSLSELSGPIGITVLGPGSTAPTVSLSAPASNLQHSHPGAAGYRRHGSGALVQLQQPRGQ